MSAMLLLPAVGRLVIQRGAGVTVPPCLPRASSPPITSLPRVTRDTDRGSWGGRAREEGRSSHPLSDMLAGCRSDCAA